MSEKQHLLLIDQQTFDHLLAGIRALQLLRESGNMPLSLVEIATRDGENDLLNGVQMDTLAENFNTGFFTPNQGETLVHFSRQSPELRPYADAAEAEYANDELEIDDDPIYSEGDEGVWVGAWVWVRKADDDDDAA